MSIDIRYIAFDAQKADEGWKQFPTDLKRPEGKQQLEDTKAYLEAVDDFDTAFEAAMAPYEQQLSETRKKIFKYLDAQGYVIPGFDWVSPKGIDPYGNPTSWDPMDKFEYVINFGILHPKNATPEQLAACKEKPIFLRTVAPHLEWEYADRLELRDQMALSFREGGELVRLQAATQTTDEPFGGDNHFDYEEIYSDEPVEKMHLLNELVCIDLFYGGVIGEHLEYPRLEELQFNCVTKNGSFASAWDRNLEEEIKEYAAERRIEFEDAKEEIEDYLYETKTVSDALHKNGNAILVKYANEVYKGNSVDEMLLERAKKYLEEFKDLLPKITSS